MVNIIVLNLPVTVIFRIVGMPMGSVVNADILGTVLLREKGFIIPEDIRTIG